jgi:type IV pilus assembly protein PilP
MKCFTLIRVAIIVALSPLLFGCFGAEKEDMQRWMTDQRNAIKPNVPAITQPKRFSPAPYLQEASMEPFNSQKLTQALKRDSNQSNANEGLVAPELTRRKEPLEAFPLDAMSLVGSLTPLGKPVALVKVDALLYQVKVGNYLGQNYGKVTKVSESEVVLREIVQDAAGEWIERPASLQLQEKAK